MCVTLSVSQHRCALSHTAVSTRPVFGRFLLGRSAALPSRWSGGNISDIFSENFLTENLGEEDAPFSEATDEFAQSEPPKELIFSLQRRGEGWGEEIMPSVTVEWRPVVVNKRIRHRSQGPDPWQEGSLESELLRAGVPRDDVEKVAAAAAAWRVTPLGRPLIDRRRRARVQRNARGVIDHLELVCGVPLGFHGIANILMKSPQILLSKVGYADRWNARVVELAAFMHLYGHCNVPHNWCVSPTLGRWVRRQRICHAQGELSEERVQILHALGFHFDENSLRLDREWEKQFDAYMDWIIRNRERRQFIDESGLNWFSLGGWPAARLAVWAIHQRELKRRGVLRDDIIKRLDYFQFRWDVESTPGNANGWTSSFAQLVVAVETHKSTLKKNKAYSMEDISFPRGEPDLGNDWETDVDAWRLSTLDNRHSRHMVSAATGIPKLDQMKGLSLAPEIELWLESQRYLWSRGRLPTEKVALLYALGVDLNPHSRKEWIHLAHLAAKELNNFDVGVEHDLEDRHHQKRTPAGPSLLVMPEDIVSVSEADDIVERVDLKTFHAIKDEVNVIAMEPEAKDVKLLTASRDNSLPRDAIKGVDLSLNEGEVNARRVVVREWMLTQQALRKEDRLMRNQMKYLAILGLTWILSKDVTEMENEQWSAHFRQLQSMSSLDGLPAQLDAFLFYQRGLHRLGLLSKERMEALESVGFHFAFREKTEEQKTWEKRITEFLKRKANHGQRKGYLSPEFRQWFQDQQTKKPSLSAVQSLQIRTIQEHLSHDF